MKYVRPVDDRDAFDTGYPGHRAQYLSQLESALVFASTVAEGGRAAGLHYHEADQLYFLFEGSMTVRYGDERQRIGPGTLVHIPAGLAHSNWNEGPGSETHLELVVPATKPGKPLAFAVEEPDDVPAEVRTTRTVTIAAVDADRLSEVDSGSGARVQRLVGPDDGVDVAIAYYAKLDPGRGGDEDRREDHDTYLFTIDGALDVEVAGQRFDVHPRSVVLLPAGVTHRYRNGGDAPTTFLAVLAPALGATFGRRPGSPGGALAVADRPA